MVLKLGENAPSYSMVKKWADEFKPDRESLEDNPCPRRPVTRNVLFHDELNTFLFTVIWRQITTLETIAKIDDIIMADRQVTEHYIATELGISQDCIHAVIHNELHMYKVSSLCVPKLLGPDLKWTRLNMSRENLVII